MKRLLILLALVTSAAYGQASGTITATGATCAVTNACLSTSVANTIATANVTVSGTYVGTLQFEGSGDGTNFFSLSGAQLTSSTAAVNTGGTWTFSVAGLTNIRVRASAYTSGTATVTILLSAAPAAVVPAATNDPCFSNTPKQSVAVNISTATTTQLVALSGQQTIYVCGFVLSMTGTTAANTVTFEYGTGATCGTGTTVLTGPISSGILTAGATVVSYENGLATVFKTIPGQALCILSTVATGPSIAGVVTFVQQ